MSKKKIMLKWDNSKNIRQSLASLLNKMLNEEISESQLRGATYTSQVLLQAIKNTELEDKIAQMEQEIEKLEEVLENQDEE